jgi:hypothetical protein
MLLSSIRRSNFRFFGRTECDRLRGIEAGHGNAVSLQIWPTITDIRRETALPIGDNNRLKAMINLAFTPV